MKKKMTSVLLAAALGLSVLPAAVYAEEAATEPETGAYEEAAESVEEPATEGEEEYSFSSDFDENGYFKGVRALDYVTLGQYEGIELTEADIAPTEEELLAELQKLVDNNTTQEQVKDPSIRIEDGDTVNIDYVGKIDGIAFEGGTASGQEVTIGVTSYIDGFLDQLIGHTPGETFDIDVTFPDPYYNNPDLSGKPAVFTITVNYISQAVVPDLDDEFIIDSTNGEHESVEGYKAFLGVEMRKENLRNALMDKLFSESEVSEVPESVTDVLYQQQYEQIAQQASYYGVEVEELVSYYGMTLDDLTAELRAEAEEYGKRFLTIQAVREDAGLEMTAEKAMEMLDVDADTYEFFVSYYGEPYIFFSESTEMVLDYMAKSAVIDGQPAVEEETEAQEEAGEPESETEEAAEELASEAEEAVEELVSEAEEAVEELSSEVAE